MHYYHQIARVYSTRKLNDIVGWSDQAKVLLTREPKETSAHSDSTNGICWPIKTIKKIRM